MERHIPLTKIANSRLSQNYRLNLPRVISNALKDKIHKTWKKFFIFHSNSATCSVSKCVLAVVM